MSSMLRRNDTRKSPRGKTRAFLGALWVLLLTFVVFSSAQAHQPAMLAVPQIDVAMSAAVTPLIATDEDSCPGIDHRRGDCCMNGTSCHAAAAVVSAVIVPVMDAQAVETANAPGLLSGEIVPLLPPPRS